MCMYHRQVYLTKRGSFCSYLSTAQTLFYNGRIKCLQLEQIKVVVSTVLSDLSYNKI